MSAFPQKADIANDWDRSGNNMTERGQLGLALADFKVMTSSFGRL